jgi:hypothetical protein
LSGLRSSVRHSGKHCHFAPKQHRQTGAVTAFDKHKKVFVCFRALLAMKNVLVEVGWKDAMSILGAKRNNANEINSMHAHR